MSLSLGTAPTTALADTGQVQAQQQQTVPTSSDINDNNGVERTLNFLHTVGDQGAIETISRKNELIDVMATEELPHLRSRLLDVILHTNNQDVLKALAASPKACRNYHEWIKCALRERDWVILGKMVQILNHLPLSPQTLIDYKLGRAIKVLKEKCKSNDKEELLSQTIQLMNKWSDQHNHQRSARSDPNTESIRDSESPPSFPPSIVPLGSSVAEKRKSPPTTINSPAKKAVRLAISAEPPAKPSLSKPQAQVNYGLFNMLNNGSHTNSGSSKLSNLRREESFLVESSPLSSSSTSSSTATTTSTSSTFHTAPMVPSLSDSSPNGLPLKTPSSPKKKKSVNFKSDHVLVQVRYYAKNTWETSDHPDGLIVDDRENEQGPEISNQHNGLPTKSHPTLENWQCPPRLLLAQDCRRAGMIYTEESNYQRQLEAITPPTVYRSIDEIPPTPEEPDSPGCENDIGVKIIPLEDLANYGDATSEECYNDEMDDSIPENNKGYSATTVDDSASVPIAPMSSSSSKEYPNLDYLDLQGILNAVASQTGASASTSSMTPTQQQQEQLAVPQHQVPSQRQHQYYQHDLKNQPPTQPSKHHNNNNNINHSTNPSRGNHHHPHRSSRGGAGAGRSDQHNGNNRPSRPPRGRARCRYLNTKKGCLFGDRCNYSHDI